METLYQQIEKKPRKCSGIGLDFSIILIVRSILEIIFPESLYVDAFLIVPIIGYCVFFVVAISCGILGLTDCNKNKKSIIESILSICFSVLSVLLPIILFSTHAIYMPPFM